MEEEMKKAFNFEITKLLAKVMQVSLKRKEVTEVVNRILVKMEEILKTEDISGELSLLKEEFECIKKEIK